MRYVKYVGLAHTRMVTAADWRSVGIAADPMVWDAFNGFAVPLDAFTEDQIRKVIDPDVNFVITGGDTEFTPDLSATRSMTPQEFEAPRVDILDPVDAPNVSVPGSETSTASPAGRGGTGRGTAGHDKP